MSVEHNKATVQKFVDALNQQNNELLAESATPDIAKEWTATLSWLYATMKDHHIDITAMVAEGDMVAVKMATRGYHSGELFGIPATGKAWTNRVYTFFRLVDGRIAEVDAIPDVENHIKQIGGIITTAPQN
jgi:predicted ester cyclase